MAQHRAFPRLASNIRARGRLLTDTDLVCATHQPQPSTPEELAEKVRQQVAALANPLPNTTCPICQCALLIMFAFSLCLTQTPAASHRKQLEERANPNQMRWQVEFYFSKENLQTDLYLVSQMKQDRSFGPVTSPLSLPLYVSRLVCAGVPVGSL